MQYLGINELDPEGSDLRLELWENIYSDAGKVKDMTDSNAAWCGAFVNYILKQTGTADLEGVDSSKLGWAANFKKVGRRVAGNTTNQQLSNAQPGDIILVEANTGSKRHVAFYAGHDPQSGQVYLLGGNQKDSVSMVPFSSKKIKSVRRVRTDRMTASEQEKISELMAG